MGNRISRVGERKGMLTITELQGIANNQHSLWRARCDCGGHRENILWGNWKVWNENASCGCIEEKEKEKKSVALEKRCPNCDTVKSRSEFHKASSRTDGLQVHCIDCMRSRLQKNPEKTKRAYRNTRIKAITE